MMKKLSALCASMTIMSAGAAGQPASRSILQPTPCPQDRGPAADIVCNPVKLRALTGLGPGQSVAVLPPDYLTAGASSNIGYYAHMFATFVGRKGHVFDVVPPDIERLIEANDKMGAQEIKGDYADKNVRKLIQNYHDLATPNKLDVVWSAFTDRGALDSFAPLQESTFFAVAASLKRGGKFFVLDADVQKHCGRPTADCPADGPILLYGLPHDSALHNIESAGFRLVAERRLDIRFPDPFQARFLSSHGTRDGTHLQLYWFLWTFVRK